MKIRFVLFSSALIIIPVSYTHLDDSMLPEINRLGHPSEGVKYRLNTLLLLCQTTGADAVLCACSSIGGLVEEGSSLVSIPVFRIDEPMARLAAGYSRIGLAATLHSTIMPTTELIRRKAAMAGKEISIQSLSLIHISSPCFAAPFMPIMNPMNRMKTWNMYI